MRWQCKDPGSTPGFSTKLGMAMNEAISEIQANIDYTMMLLWIASNALSFLSGAFFAIGWCVMKDLKRIQKILDEMNTNSGDVV